MIRTHVSFDLFSYDCFILDSKFTFYSLRCWLKHLEYFDKNSSIFEKCSGFVDQLRFVCFLNIGCFSCSCLLRLALFCSCQLYCWVLVTVVTMVVVHCRYQQQKQGSGIEDDGTGGCWLE